MTRPLERRLQRLEASLTPTQAGRCHTIMGDTDEELEAKEAELLASPEWREGDQLIVFRIVDPVSGRPA